MVMDIYLLRAVAALDAKFGTGYAKANPNLVSELVRCQSSIYCKQHTDATAVA